MTTQDIMIDDWVKVKSTQKPIKVKEIKQSCIYTEGNGYGYNEIEPIPLTAEILEKNGFEKAPQVSDIEPFDTDEEGNKHYSYNKTFWGWLQPDNIFCIPANGMGWLHLKYVHELQHALRLCKIEKSIEL